MTFENNEIIIYPYRDTYTRTSTQNEKMSDQIGLLVEKLQFFIDHIRKEQGKTRKGDYFSHKEKEFEGKVAFI